MPVLLISSTTVAFWNRICNVQILKRKKNGSVFLLVGIRVKDLCLLVFSLRRAGQSVGYLLSSAVQCRD